MGDENQVAAEEQQTPSEAQPPVAPPINPPPPQQTAPTAANPEDAPTEKISKSDRIMIAATVVIAIGTLVSAGAICFQWYEMHTGGADTKAIADAAQKQVGAANRSADASQKFADTAGFINGGIADAVKNLQKQAKGIENLAGQAAPIAQANRDQSIISAGNPIVRFDWAHLGRDSRSVFVDVVVKTQGTEALIKIAADLETRKPTLKEQRSMTAFEIAQKGGGPADSNIRQFLLLQGHPDLDSPDSRLYFWGVIRYATLEGKPFQDIYFCQDTLASNVLRKKVLPSNDTPPDEKSAADYLYAGPFDKCEKPN
jgi:hypothetical protein